MLNMFLEQTSNIPLDKSKETVCLILTNHFKADRYRMHGFTFPIITTLFKDYNVITLGTKNDIEYLEQNNYKSAVTIVWDKNKFNDFKPNLERVKTHGKSARKNNEETIKQIIDSVLPTDIEISKLILPTSHGYNLPQQPLIPKKTSLELHELTNEFWDYIYDDRETIEIINNYFKNIDISYTWNCLTFGFGETNILINFIKRVAKHNSGIGMYMFVSDPLGFYPIFDIDPNINLKVMYFEDDKRGTRKLNKSPLGHLVPTFFNNYIETSSEEYEKTQDLIFAGNFFVKKSSGRIDDWNKYFQNLKNNKSKLHIPLNTNKHYGVKIGEIKSEKHEAMVKEKHGQELYEQITSHPNFSPAIDLLSLNNEYTKYKYSIILQCMSKYDSLTWRIFLYLYNDVIPFVAEEYDPFNQQIPKKFRDLLVVKSSEDIESKIKFYNENDNERISLLTELKEYYKIDQYKNMSFAEEEIRKMFK